MNEEIQTVVRTAIKDDWSGWSTTTTALGLMETYIFGNGDLNNHMNVDEFQARYNELSSDRAIIVSEIESKLRGTYLVSSETDEETGEVTNTYYSIGTETSFKADLTNGTYWTSLEVYESLKGENTWTEFKAKYASE